MYASAVLNGRSKSYATCKYFFLCTYNSNYKIYSSVKIARILHVKAKKKEQ